MEIKTVHSNDKFGLARIPIEGKDYVQDNNTFTIFNVPILAEMVQRYTDGWALKSVDEIRKVKVEAVPLTLVDEMPSHPDYHLTEMSTVDKTKFTVGYMSEPSNLKADASPKKRYADFVLYKTPKSKIIMDTYLKGEYIDTSIGFQFKQDANAGEFNGMKYDYVQRDITLDHNAILLDQLGRIGTGRMPSPIGGIGADSKEEKQMSEELKKTIDSLTKERDELKAQLAKHADAQDASVKAEMDKVQKSNDELQVELAKIKKESDEVKAELDNYKQEEQKAIDAKREELKKAWTQVADVLDKADNEFIVAKHAEFVKDQKKKTDSKKLGTDLMGPNDKQIAKSKSETARINNKYNPKKEE